MRVSPGLAKSSRSFFRTFIFYSVLSSLPLPLLRGRGRSPSRIRSRLQPRLLVAHAPLPGGDLLRMLEGKPDIVEAFDEAHAIGHGQVECDIRAARAADALGLQIDREGRGAVGAQHARLEGARVGLPELDRKKTVLQAILPVDVGKAARHDATDA